MSQVWGEKQKEDFSCSSSRAEEKISFFPLEREGTTKGTLRTKKKDQSEIPWAGKEKNLEECFGGGKSEFDGYYRSLKRRKKKIKRSTEREKRDGLRQQEKKEKGNSPHWPHRRKRENSSRIRLGRGG